MQLVMTEYLMSGNTIISVLAQILIHQLLSQYQAAGSSA